MCSLTQFCKFYMWNDVTETYYNHICLTNLVDWVHLMMNLHNNFQASVHTMFEFQVTKNLAGMASGTATRATNVGIEKDQVLIGVLTC